MMVDMMRLLNDTRYAIGAFAFGALIAVPAGFFSGFLSIAEAVVFEALFIANLVATTYMLMAKSKSRAKDPFVKDYYLGQLDLKSDRKYGVSLSIILFVGVPLSFLFDATTTIYTLLSVLDPTTAASLSVLVKEIVWTWIVALFFVLPLVVAAHIREMAKGKPRAS